MKYSAAQKCRYKNLECSCAVYKIRSGETLLLEKEAANILKVIPDQPITYIKIEKLVKSVSTLDPECFNLENVLEHLVHAGLIKKVA
jgi:hypothetical protein